MKLVMYLGSHCIDAVPLNEGRLSQPGYLGSVKRELMDLYASELQRVTKEPEFLIALTDDVRTYRNEPASFSAFTNGSAKPAAFATR